MHESPGLGPETTGPTGLQFLRYKGRTNSPPLRRSAIIVDLSKRTVELTENSQLEKSRSLTPTPKIT